MTDFSLSRYVAAEKLRVEPALERVVARLEAEVTPTSQRPSAMVS